MADGHGLHEPVDMVDVVYNLASPPPGLREQEYERFNGFSLRNLLEEAEEHGVKSFVHLSCVDVYGFGGGPLIDSARRPKPEGAYQKSKMEGERVVSEFGKAKKEMKVHIVRAVRPVGPRDQSLTVPLMRMAKRGRIVLPAGAAARMSLAHPKDIAQAMLKASRLPESGGVYNVSSFESSVGDFARRLSDGLGAKAEITQQGLLSGKRELPRYAAEQVRAGLTLKDQSAWKDIGYAPEFTIEKTVEETIEWYRKEPWATRNLE